MKIHIILYGFTPTTYAISDPVLMDQNVEDVAIGQHTIYTTLDGKTYTVGHNMNGAGDYYNGFMERPYKIASPYDFSKLLNVNENKEIVKNVTVKSAETVQKAKQSMTVKAKTVKIKYKKLKKKKQTVTVKIKIK